MPAGYGKKRCESCYSQDKLDKRVKIAQAALHHRLMADRFHAFGQWLCTETGVHKAANTINRYLSFFQDVERRWEDFPSYEDLLTHFGTAALRRVELPMRWLEAERHIVVDPQAKQDDSDRRRIERTLATFQPGSDEHKALASYHEILKARLEAGKTSIKSVRLALTPAATLLTSSGDADLFPPTQELVDVYLARTPGQRAALAGFVAHLRDRHAAELVLPRPDPKRQKAKRRARRTTLDKKTADLLRHHRDDPKLHRKWLELALVQSLEISRKEAKRLAGTATQVKNGDGYSVLVDGVEFHIPAPPHLPGEQSGQ